MRSKTICVEYGKEFINSLIKEYFEKTKHGQLKISPTSN